MYRKLASYFREEVLETVESKVSGRLEIWFSYGRLELNTASVNYSFGSLDSVFREAFEQEKLRIPTEGTVLLLGVGGGNVVCILSEIGHYTITGVELDPEVIRLGRKYFGLDDFSAMNIVLADATQFVQETKETYDMVIVDLFVDDTVPHGAEQKSFLKRLGELLNPGGTLFFNRLMHTDSLAAATEKFTRTIQEILPGTRYIKAHKNRMLIYEKA